MKGRLATVVSFVAFAFVVGFYGWQIWIIPVQPKHQGHYHGSQRGAGEIVRPKSADEQLADYTEALAIFTAALAAFAAIQMWYLTRADKAMANSVAEAARAAVAMERVGTNLGQTLLVRKNLGNSKCGPICRSIPAFIFARTKGLV